MGSREQNLLQRPSENEIASGQLQLHLYIPQCDSESRERRMELRARSFMMISPTGSCLGHPVHSLDRFPTFSRVQTQPLGDDSAALDLAPSMTMRPRPPLGRQRSECSASAYPSSSARSQKPTRRSDAPPRLAALQRRKRWSRRPKRKRPAWTALG